jgi:hypothetical protein
MRMLIVVLVRERNHIGARARCAHVAMPPAQLLWPAGHCDWFGCVRTKHVSYTDIGNFGHTATNFTEGSYSESPSPEANTSRSLSTRSCAADMLVQAHLHRYSCFCLFIV